tara:strand:+ start:662 stop:856 length:195 start_codon:yes stop_codon:yes gene_type:complete
MLFYYFVNYIKTSNLLHYIRNSGSTNNIIKIIDNPQPEEEEVLQQNEDVSNSPKLDPELHIVDN